MDEVYNFLKEIAPTYYLATNDNGQARVRPFGTIDLYEGKLYIQTGKSKNVFQQLKADPRAEICACSGPEWVRITCELIEDDSVEARKHMLDNYPQLRAMYDENDNETAVMYMQNAQATFESFADSSKRVIGW